MAILDIWRQEIYPIVQPGFLRRDMNMDYLFVSNYPRLVSDSDYVTEQLEEHGFHIVKQNGLAHLDGTAEKYHLLMKSFPEKFENNDSSENYLAALANKLFRHESALTEQPLSLIRLTLRCEEQNDAVTLCRLLPPSIAELQRKHQSLPSCIAGILAEMSSRGGVC